MVTETVQKSVRLSLSVHNTIERYRGWTFTDKLHNYINDAERWRRQVDRLTYEADRLTFENEQLRLQIERLKSDGS